MDNNDKPVKYYYYAYDPATKEHHFSKTYKEHLAFLESLKEG
jgi:cell division protein YceG involved in septum cleavage